MRTYLINAGLRSPLIATGYMTFDALLAAALFDRIGNVEKAHDAIPIARTGELFAASGAILDKKSEAVQETSRGVAIAANLRATHDLRPDLIARIRTGRLPKISLARRREFGAVLSEYRLQHVHHVRWVVTCDLDAVTELLRDLPFIGKKRAQGFGEVSNWDAELADLDPLLDEAGHPRRPIPVDMFQGDRSLPISDAAWKPAYWNPAHRAPCYAPLPLG